MNPKGFLSAPVVMLVVLLGAMVSGYFLFKNLPLPQPATESAPPPASDSRIYENQYMKVAVPAGWTAAQVNQNPAAVNITKGNYILYINPQASQASGVIGGRFAEIAMGAPSADAVMIEQPSPPCGSADTDHPATPGHVRVDLYIGPQVEQNWCNVPTNGQTVWYFSYVSEEGGGGYFNYYRKMPRPTSYVITMAYNSKDVNSFPVKGSPALNAMLGEMTGIVQSVELKQK